MESTFDVTLQTVEVDMDPSIEQKAELTKADTQITDENLKQSNLKSINENYDNNEDDLEPGEVITPPASPNPKLNTTTTSKNYSELDEIQTKKMSEMQEKIDQECTYVKKSKVVENVKTDKPDKSSRPRKTSIENSSERDSAGKHPQTPSTFNPFKSNPRRLGTGTPRSYNESDDDKNSKDNRRESNFKGKDGDKKRRNSNSFRNVDNPDGRNSYNVSSGYLKNQHPSEFRHGQRFFKSMAEGWGDRGFHRSRGFMHRNYQRPTGPRMPYFPQQNQPFRGLSRNKHRPSSDSLWTETKPKIPFQLNNSVTSSMLKKLLTKRKLYDKYMKSTPKNDDKKSERASTSRKSETKIHENLPKEKSASVSSTLNVDETETPKKKKSSIIKKNKNDKADIIIDSNEKSLIEPHSKYVSIDSSPILTLNFNDISQKKDDNKQTTSSTQLHSNSIIMDPSLNKTLTDPSESNDFPNTHHINSLNQQTFEKTHSNSSKFSVTISEQLSADKNEKPLKCHQDTNFLNQNYSKNIDSSHEKILTKSQHDSHISLTPSNSRKSVNVDNKSDCSKKHCKDSSELAIAHKKKEKKIATDKLNQRLSFAPDEFLFPEVEDIDDFPLSKDEFVPVKPLKDVKSFSPDTDDYLDNWENESDTKIAPVEIIQVKPTKETIDNLNENEKPDQNKPKLNAQELNELEIIENDMRELERLFKEVGGMTPNESPEITQIIRGSPSSEEEVDEIQDGFNKPLLMNPSPPPNYVPDVSSPSHVIDTSINNLDETSILKKPQNELSIFSGDEPFLFARFANHMINNPNRHLFESGAYLDSSMIDDDYGADNNRCPSPAQSESSDSSESTNSSESSSSSTSSASSSTSSSLSTTCAKPANDLQISLEHQLEVLAARPEYANFSLNDLKEIQKIEISLEKLKVMRESYDSSDELLDGLPNMEILFMQKKNLIIRKYALERPVQHFVRTLNTTEMPTYLENRQAFEEHQNSVLGSNREAIRLRISPVKIVKASIGFQLDDEQENHFNVYDGKINERPKNSTKKQEENHNNFAGKFAKLSKEPKKYTEQPSFRSEGRLPDRFRRRYSRSKSPRRTIRQREVRSYNRRGRSPVRYSSHWGGDRRGGRRISRSRTPSRSPSRSRSRNGSRSRSRSNRNESPCRYRRWNDVPQRRGKLRSRSRSRTWSRSRSYSRSYSRSPLPFKPPSPPSLNTTPQHSRSRSPSLSKSNPMAHQIPANYIYQEEPNNYYFAQQRYFYNASPNRLPLDGRINTPLNQGPPNSCGPYNTNIYNGCNMRPPYYENACMPHQQVIGGTVNGYSKIPTIIGSHNNAIPINHYGAYYPPFNQPPMQPQNSSLVHEPPKTGSIVQKGNMLEIVPNLEIPTNAILPNNSLIQLQTNQAASTNKNVAKKSQPIAKRRKLEPSWKEEVNKRQIACAVLQLRKENEGSKGILKTSAIESNPTQKPKKKVYFADGVYPNTDPDYEDRKAVETSVRKKYLKLKKRKGNNTPLKENLQTKKYDHVNDDIEVRRPDPELENLPPPPPPIGSPPHKAKQPIYIRPPTPGSLLYFHFDLLVNSMYVSQMEQPIPPRLLDPKLVPPVVPPGTIGSKTVPWSGSNLSKQWAPSNPSTRKQSPAQSYPNQHRGSLRRQNENEVNLGSKTSACKTSNNLVNRNSPLIVNKSQFTQSQPGVFSKPSTSIQTQNPITIRRTNYRWPAQTPPPPTPTTLQPEIHPQQIPQIQQIQKTQVPLQSPQLPQPPHGQTKFNAPPPNITSMPFQPTTIFFPAPVPNRPIHRPESIIHPTYARPQPIPVNLSYPPPNIRHPTPIINPLTTRPSTNNYY